MSLFRQSKLIGVGIVVLIPITFLLKKFLTIQSTVKKSSTGGRAFKCSQYINEMQYFNLTLNGRA